MKKINFLSFALIAFLCSFIMSCDNNDGVIEENEVPNGTQTFVYSVHVKSSSINNGRAQGLTGVKVTVNQNGSIKTKTTDATGIVSFEKMKRGAVSVFVAAPSGYSSVNGVGEIGCTECDYPATDVDQVEYSQLDVVLPRQGATAQGKVYADTDFSGDILVGEVPAGAVVIAKVSNDYEPNVYTTSVGSDGAFAFTNLPEGVEVEFSVNFKKADNSTPPVERTFYFTGLSSYYVLDVNNPLSLGRIDLTY